MAEIVVTEKNFEEVVLKADKPVLVDFWATWCGPCRMLAPTVAKIAEEQEGKIVVAKIDVDEAPALAAQFGISSIPTLAVFRDGAPVKMSVGVQSKSMIEEMLA